MLNKHSVSVLAVVGPAGLVHCMNQSLEAHRLHSFLVYFKAKGWAQSFTQSQHSHPAVYAAADASWATTWVWHLPFYTDQKMPCYTLKLASDTQRTLNTEAELQRTNFKTVMKKDYLHHVLIPIKKNVHVYSTCLSFKPVITYTP